MRANNANTVRLGFFSLLWLIGLALGSCVLESDGAYSVNSAQCTGCKACASACHHGAIQFDSLGKATIDANKCVGCGKCVSACSVHAIEK